MRKTDATQSVEKKATLIAPDELIKRLRAGTKETHVIRVRDAEIPVRVLTIEEMNKVRRESIKGGLLGQNDDADRAVAAQKAILAMASTMPGSVPILGPKVWIELSVDEVNHLYNEYIKVMDDVNPAVERLNDGEWRALVEAAKKNSISAKDCSLTQLRAIFSDWQDMIQKRASHSSPTVS